MTIFSYSLLPRIFKFRRSSLRLVFLITIVYNIVRIPPPPPPNFKAGGGVNFDYLPRRRGESEKLEKGSGSMVQGQVLLKVCVWGGGCGGWHFLSLIFSRFIIFTYRNYITLCKIVLCIWRETIFFCHHTFMKNSHSKLSKNEPENIPSIKITYLKKDLKN